MLPCLVCAASLFLLSTFLARSLARSLVLRRSGFLHGANSIPDRGSTANPFAAVVRLHDDGLVGRSTSAAKHGAAVAPIGCASILRRQRGPTVGRKRVDQTFGPFEEGANRLRLAHQVRVGPIAVHDATHPLIGAPGEEHEVKSVVVAETHVGDESVRPPIAKMRACIVKAPGDDDAREIGASMLNVATGRGLRLDEQ
jgi:hypothetical protein